MPHPKVKCPTPKCKNLKQPDAAVCGTCRLDLRRASAVKPGAPGATTTCACGGPKTREAETCGPCRQVKQREETEARRKQALDAKVERERRLAENAPTAEDTLRIENTEQQTRIRTLEEVVKTYRGKTRVEDALVANLREFIEKNPYRPQLRAPRALKLTGKAKPHEMMPVVSDAHYPEVVDPAAAYGVTYNGDICLRRLEQIRDTVLRYRDLRATSYPVQKITVAVNGDMLSGSIHEELEVTNENPMSEAMVRMSYALFDFGKALAEEVPNVEMIVMPGNHPRLEKKPRHKDKWNNWEWVMGKFVQALARDAFTVTVPKDLVYRHKVFNKIVGLTHGDGVKAQSFAGIPFYSLKQRRDALNALLRSLGAEQLDLVIYGHFHQLLFEEGQGCGFLINGSIKGYDEYIMNTRYAGQTAIQALLTFHPTHGLTDLSRINLGHIQ